MYRIKWNDGDIEYYALKKDFLTRIYFLCWVCGYVRTVGFNADRWLDGVSCKVFDDE